MASKIIREWKKRGLRRASSLGQCRHLTTTLKNLNSQEQTKNEGCSEDEIRESVLEAALPFVHELGWSQKALSAGAESLSFSSAAHGMFPNGGVDLAHYLYFSLNRRLATDLETQIATAEAEGTPKKSTRLFISSAVESRLRMLIPYLDVWPKAMGLFALPPNSSEALNNLKTLCDDIWFHAGDRSTDFNWYTKRMLLAGVYKSSELYMLQDQSEDFHETFAFMDRRMADIQIMGNCARKMQFGSDNIGDVLYGGMHVIRNVLGANDVKR